LAIKPPLACVLRTLGGNPVQQHVVSPHRRRNAESHWQNQASHRRYERCGKIKTARYLLHAAAAQTASDPGSPRQKKKKTTEAATRPDGQP